jgi:3-dehydroquinate dehydratase/shikimate dehydrogenase
VTLPGVDPICVVIGRTRHKMVQAEIREAHRQGAGLIEIRLDLLKMAPDFKRLLAEKPCPLIATCRRFEDGGKYGGNESARQMLLRQAIVAGFDWVDLETDVADTIRRFKDVRRIVSYHNMREVPADLESIHARMCQQDADIVKVAVRALKPTDNLRVLALLKDPPKPTVALCMGDQGMPARVLAAKYGAPFTYAAFNKDRTLAPGMPNFDDMRDLYHYPKIDAETQVYGVLGDPVAHSLSPLVHNHAMRSAGLNAVYLPFRVPRGDLAGFLREFDKLPVCGYSVTIPHKETAAALAKEKAPSVKITGAANTLVRDEGGFIAYNTDFEGVLAVFRDQLPASTTASPLQGKLVMVLGAGGVARSVAFACQREGAIVTIVNRTAERARELAEEAGCKCADWGARHQILSDIVVNCTSVGMHPNVDQSPVARDFLKDKMTVFDTVYTPESTLLIKEARDQGCRVITGVELFVRQAALQFQLFTGREPPLELMQSVLRRGLSPVHIKPDPAA